jgi:hypothetical protein
MKILVIIAGHEMNREYVGNIELLNNFLKQDQDNTVDYCGISNTDDFINYEDIIEFKYKVINQKRQLSKVCDFISDTYDKLDYDWYIKVRPDFKFLEPINFNSMKNNAINARVRDYIGPKRIKYGMSVNGEGIHRNVGACVYSEVESRVILDDCIYIFDNNVVRRGAFNRIDTDNLENEWFHTSLWSSRGIELNIVGINTICLKYDLSCGSVNM